MVHTKIVATIGPASMSCEVMERMVKAGLSCARINVSHGDISQYKEIVGNWRKVARHLPILIDTKGPEIRLRLKESLQVQPGDEITINSTRQFPYFDHDFYRYVKKGDLVFFHDGLIKSRIVKITKNAVMLSIRSQGEIRDRAGVNVPGMIPDWPILTREDKSALKFAMKEYVDFIALSFVRSAKDITAVRKILGKHPLKIIAKIENVEAVRNIDEILEAADGLMVARGDLGVELLPEKVPLIQKEIIRKCNQAAKPVITATQMLESMVSNPIPTRAETSDAANAVLDGSDAVMLSAETAIGKYPDKAVKTLARIAREIEPNVPSRVQLQKSMSISDTISRSIYQMTQAQHVDKIVSKTRSGYTAQMISRFRLNRDIIAITSSEHVARQLNLSFGVIPLHSKKKIKDDGMLEYIKEVLACGLLQSSDVVVFTAGAYTTRRNVSNMILMHRVRDLIKYCKS